MPQPSLSKTWTYTKINQALGTQGSVQAARRKWMYETWKSLVALGAVVDHSCNSVTAGTPGDGVDRFSAPTDFVWATGASARSWGVLRFPNIHTDACVLIHCFKTTGGTLEISIAASASTHSGRFSGGTTTAAPTATNSWSLRDGVSGASSAWGEPGGSSDYSGALHVLASTDGQSFRVFHNIASNTPGFWCFEKPSLPVTGWSNPFVAMIHGTGAGSHCTTFALLNGVTPFTATAPPAAARGAAAMQLAFTSEGHGGGPEGSKITVPNDLSAEYGASPIGLASETALSRGRHGKLNDLWWGNTGAAHGTTFPNDASRQFVQFGNIIHPWNGSVPLLA